MSERNAQAKRKDNTHRNCEGEERRKRERGKIPKTQESAGRDLWERGGMIWENLYGFYFNNVERVTHSRKKKRDVTVGESERPEGGGN